MNFLLPLLLSLQMGYRTGREACWIQFTDSSHQRICVSHHAWIKWLNSPHLQPICSDPTQRKRVSSPPENSKSFPHFKRISTSQEWLPQSNPLVNQSHSSLLLMLQRMERVREKASLFLADHDSFGILRSLLLGEGTSKSSLNLFRKLGFVHLNTASGIHIYAVCNITHRVISFLCFNLGISVPIGLGASRVLSALFCLSIWVLNGLRFGMLRPWLILLARATAQWLGFRWTRASPLFLALLIEWGISLFKAKVGYPGSSYSGHSGRWVYALAVGGGLFLAPRFRSTHLGLAIGSWIFVALWEAWSDHSVALITPLISLITLPVLCLGAYPLSLMSLLLNEMGFHHPAHLIASFLDSTLSLGIIKITELALFPGNLWVLSQESLIVGFVVATLWIFIKSKKIKALVLAALFFLTLSIRVFHFHFHFHDQQTSFTLAKQIDQLDVGQGDAALITSSNSNRGPQNGMIDTGSKRALSLDQWLQLFAERGVTSLNWIALSHLDEDHSGGLIPLSKFISIDCVMAPRDEVHSKRGKKLSEELRKKGVLLQEWNSTCSPFPNTVIQTSRSASQRNGIMGAFWIPLEFGGFYLSAGDLSATEESQLLQWVSPFLRKASTQKVHRILKAGHHGSKHSNSTEFLKAVQPTEVWISSGFGNRYGHPAPDVLQRLNDLQIPYLRTDQVGLISTERKIPLE